MSMDSNSTRWWFSFFSNFYTLWENDPISLIFFQLGQEAISFDVACLPVMRRRWTSQMAMVCALSVEAFRWTWSIPSWHLVTQAVFSQMIRPKIWTEKGDQWSWYRSKEMTLIHRSKETGEISFQGAITAPLRSHELVAKSIQIIPIH